MDDATAKAATWCDEARGLCDGAAGDGALRASPTAGTLAMARLDAIAAGMKVRRQLDGLEPDEATEKARRAVVGRLAELAAAGARRPGRPAARARPAPRGRGAGHGSGWPRRGSPRRTC